MAKNNLRKRRTGRYFGTCSKAPSLSCHLTAVILPVQPLSRLSCRGLFRGLEQPFFHNCRGSPPPAVYPVVAGSGCLPIPTGPHSNFSLHLSAESGLNALSASIPVSTRHKVRAQKRGAALSPIGSFRWASHCFLAAATHRVLAQNSEHTIKSAPQMNFQ